MRAKLSDVVSSAIGSTECRGEMMLLHASRLVVPREGKATIDVTAPLPERFGEWRNEA
jgi:hypothetical protein